MTPPLGRIVDAVTPLSVQEGRCVANLRNTLAHRQICPPLRWHNVLHHYFIANTCD
jgi:hypothetical protein